MQYVIRKKEKYTKWMIKKKKLNICICLSSGSRIATTHAKSHSDTYIHTHNDLA